MVQLPKGDLPKSSKSNIEFCFDGKSNSYIFLLSNFKNILKEISFLPEIATELNYKFF